MSEISECIDEVVEAFESFLESVEAVIVVEARDPFILLPRLLSAQGRRGVSGRGLPSTGEQLLQSPTKDMEMFGMEGRDADDDHNWWYSVLKMFHCKIQGR